MTICLENDYEMMKFFSRCMYEKGCCKECTFPIFDEVSVMTAFEQISVKTEKTIEEVKEILKTNKIKFRWVSEF